MRQYTYKYPRPCVAADAAIVCLTSQGADVLLIQRKNEPYKGKWALPGGFVEMDETCDRAAERELEEETGIKGIALKQFHTYSAVHRDPRHRTISVIYYAVVEATHRPEHKPGDDAAESRWFHFDALPQLAFDHNLILTELKRYLAL
ncbi:MAG: NUDIX hydrolase [Bacteroidales bacterium]|nr:NUDIX hydrolase [Bacteroidales bacterium]HPE87753.1 NUDIX hydrolase [Bacteroidales bacterium]